jgi:hypothetical protein
MGASFNWKGNPMRRWFLMLAIMVVVSFAIAQAVAPLWAQAPGNINPVCPNMADYSGSYSAIPKQNPGEPIVVNENTDMILESLGIKGEEVEGRKRIVVRYINRLRYSFAVSIDVTTVPNPSLPQAFLVPSGMTPHPNLFGAAKRETNNSNGTKTLSGFDRTFDDIQSCNNGFERYLKEISDEAKSIAAKIEQARRSYQGILGSYPAILSPDEADKLRSQAEGAVNTLRSAIEKPYPSDYARVVLNALSAYLHYLTLLEATPGFEAWNKIQGNASRYLNEKQRPENAKDQLANFIPGSNEDKGARAEQERIAYWKLLFETFAQYTIREEVKDKNENSIPGLIKGHLFLPVSIDCHTVFGKGKQSKISYTITDLYTNTSQVMSGVVTSVCPPLLTVSAGVGFSTLGTQTPGFIPTAVTTSADGNTATTAEEKIGYTEKSSLKPVFVVQMNALIASLGKDWRAYGSLGAATVNRDDTTNLEWLFGLSLAFKHSIFLTPAFHLGKQTSIAGGFKEGDGKKATGLNAVPTLTNWKPGFAFTITYPLNR